MERFNPTGFTGTSATPEGAEFAADKYPGLISQIVTTEDLNNPGRQKEYRCVKLDSTMTVNPYDGAVAWWANRALGTVTTSPTTLGRGAVAGVFCKTPSTLVNRAVYVQTKGLKTNVKFVDAPTAAPSAARLHVIPSATAAKADCLAAGSAPTYPILGYSAGTINAGDQTAAVDLNVSDISG